MLNSSNVSSLDVLIISERPDHLRPLIRTLDASSARVSACFTIRQAQEIFSRQPVDLVFSDEYLSDGSYRELLQASRFAQAATSFVLLLHTGEWEEYLDAMRLGAFEVLRCPLKTTEVEATILRAVEHKEFSVARSAAQAATAAAPTQQDLLFDKLLGNAAAALAPADSAGAPSAAQAAPQPGDRRPKVIRRDVA